MALIVKTVMIEFKMNWYVPFYVCSRSKTSFRLHQTARVKFAGRCYISGFDIKPSTFYTEVVRSVYSEDSDDGTEAIQGINLRDGDQDPAWGQTNFPGVFTMMRQAGPSHLKRLWLSSNIMSVIISFTRDFTTKISVESRDPSRAKSAHSIKCTYPGLGQII